MYIEKKRRKKYDTKMCFSEKQKVWYKTNSEEKLLEKECEEN